MKLLLKLTKAFAGRCAGIRLVWPAFVLANAGLAGAQLTTCILTAPSQPLTAGAQGAVRLYCLNNSSNEVSRTFEPSLDGILASGSNSFKMVLLLTSRSGMAATIPPGGFVKHEYVFDIPATISGQVTLVVSGYNQVVVQVERAASGMPITAQTSPPLLATDETASSKASSPLLMGFLGRHIFPYEPIYFLLGNYPAAEFQFSLKYKLFDLNGDWNPASHAYFAYTQTSFWDLISRDPSFYDTSYKPSAFLFYTNVNKGDVFQLDLQGGYEHESNGRGGSEERSLNTAYLQPTIRFELPENFEFSLQPRVWEYLSLGGNNPDLPDYRGYAELRSALTWSQPRNEERIQLAARFRVGEDGDHAGWLFDLRFNLPFLLRFNPAIDLQYFNGYGQTLRQYNQTSTGFRAGLCLWY